MMGPKQKAQAALFHEFWPDAHVPRDHLLRSIDRFVDLKSICAHLADFYSHNGRQYVDPGSLIRMLLVGYCFGIRSERRLCEEVHLNLRDYAEFWVRSGALVPIAQETESVVSQLHAARVMDRLLWAK